MHLSNNTLLQGGKYKIVRFISSGGFGCTYEAEHVMLHKRVAIKEFFVKDFCNRDETTSQISVGITSKTALVDKLKKKFVEEAQSLCALEHPNIVHVFDVFEDNGTAYYVMDYIDGPSLNDLVKKNGPMSESKALEYIKQVADALKYVHSRNRLHLDIKPGNIMVDDKDRAILIDFGASKQYDEEAGENTSTLLGKTPGYAPLEQMGNDVVKFLPSTDIYALGATLYKLLTGVTPPSASLLASGETLDMPLSISLNTREAIEISMRTIKMKRPQCIDDFCSLLFSVEKDSSPSSDDSTIIEDIDRDCTIIDEVPSSKIQSDSKNFSKSKISLDSQGMQREDMANIPTSAKDANTKDPQKNKNGLWLKLCILGIIIFVILMTFPLPESKSNATLHIENASEKVFKDKNGVPFTYTGEIVDGMPEGMGTGYYPYGSYTGEYKRGLRQGKGKFESTDGSNKYEGTFSNDSYKEGTLHSSGLTFKGTFFNEQPYNGTWYDANNNEYAIIENGKTN